MGWVAISGPGAGAMAARGAAPAGSLLRAAGPAELAGRGTLLIEAELGAVDALTALVDIPVRHPVSGRLSLWLGPEGLLTLELVRGGRQRRATLTLPTRDRAEVLRFVFSWDCGTGGARLVVERPERDGAPLAAALADPVALPLEGLSRAVLQPTPEILDARVDFIALSDSIEPIGPMPGLAGGTCVDTPEGRRAVEDLRRGDLVLIRGEGAVPVLAAVRRSLPARGLFRPVQLFAPHHGLSRDVVVGAGQRLVTSGEEVRRLFRAESVLVAARHMIAEGSGIYADSGPLVTLHQLLLPDQQVLGICGAEMESLHVGRLRRSAALVEASLLAGYQRSRLPQQEGHALPVLRDYEARMLASHRAA
ncbi:MAG: hypothetical protein GYB53_00890 [Rhodobacteraceae bacterium]|nr:hypothetical protein [Paracoccaceae bacterium]MBR9821538.1 hypothetical protein [Paracoccaceae bacterium]